MMTTQEVINSIECDESDENVEEEMTRLWSMPLAKVETATYYMVGQIVELKRAVTSLMVDKNDEE